jgi:hypothetical protein
MFRAFMCYLGKSVPLNTSRFLKFEWLPRYLSAARVQVWYKERKEAPRSIQHFVHAFILC